MLIMVSVIEEKRIMVYMFINIHLFKIIKKLHSWGANVNGRSPSYFCVCLLIFKIKQRATWKYYSEFEGQRLERNLSSYAPTRDVW